MSPLHTTLALVMGLGSIVAHAQDGDGLVLNEVNRRAITILAQPAVSEQARREADDALDSVLSDPARLMTVPPSTEVSRFWQAQGLHAVHQGGDPTPALRLACLIDPLPLQEMQGTTYETLFTDACGEDLPELAPLELGELSANARVWVDGVTHAPGQYVRSGRHLVQVTEEGTLVSSRWLATDVGPDPLAERAAKKRCTGRCRSRRIGGAAIAVAIVAGLGAGTVAAFEVELD